MINFAVRYGLGGATLMAGATKLLADSTGGGALETATVTAATYAVSVVAIISFTVWAVRDRTNVETRMRRLESNDRAILTALRKKHIVVPMAGSEPSDEEPEP